jgi:hypothetical protein
LTISLDIFEHRVINAQSYPERVLNTIPKIDLRALSVGR